VRNILIFFWFFILLSSCSILNADHRVRIDSGWLLGSEENEVLSFKGIPFAASTEGINRWLPPQKKESWRGTRDAQDYGDFCPQSKRDTLWFELGKTSEDCLSLNVWTPKKTSATKLPVMVWIHGGGYLQGSGNIPRLNNPEFVKQDVVLVTVNYRLNVFGFFAHPDLVQQSGDEMVGNYGLLDVIAALEWIQRNINQFNGDPNNVTVFGESAGASLISYLMITPESKGLFHKAISQSAAVGLAPDTHINERVGFNVSGMEIAKKFTQRMGLELDQSMDQLRQLSSDEIIQKLDPRSVFGPMIDGTLIPDHVGLLFAQGKQHDVPFLIGGNSWEASLGRQIGGGFSPEFISRLVPKKDRDMLYPGLQGEQLEDQVFGDLVLLSTGRYMANQMAYVDAKTYHYHFSYVASEKVNKQPGAAHADDIAFVMKTLGVELENVSEKDKQISNLMHNYWVQFAKTGNPNLPGQPKWTPYNQDNGSVLEIGDTIALKNNFLNERINYHINRGTNFLQSMTK
jgi:para-nitrobenzyl esterase